MVSTQTTLTIKMTKKFGCKEELRASHGQVNTIKWLIHSHDHTHFHSKKSNILLKMCLNILQSCVIYEFQINIWQYKCKTTNVLTMNKQKSTSRYDTLHNHPEKESLTCLIRGDIDRGVLRDGWTLGGHAIDSLNLEAIMGVSLKIPHGRLFLCQTQSPRRHLHVIVTSGARSAIMQALFTHDVVNDVTSSAQISWLGPLERHGGLIHDGDHV